MIQYSKRNSPCGVLHVIDVVRGAAGAPVGMQNTVIGFSAHHALGNTRYRPLDALLPAA